MCYCCHVFYQPINKIPACGYLGIFIFILFFLQVERGGYSKSSIRKHKSQGHFYTHVNQFSHFWTSSLFRFLPATLFPLLTKTNPLYLIASSCTFMYKRKIKKNLQGNVVVHMHIDFRCINGFSVHVISLHICSST